MVDFNVSRLVLLYDKCIEKGGAIEKPPEVRKEGKTVMPHPGQST
jgi:hypothetical protein